MWEKFFPGNISPTQYRILVHLKNDFSGWKCFGPFDEGSVASEMEKIKKLIPAQREIGVGRIEGRGDRMNKIEIYKGLRLVSEENFLRSKSNLAD